MEEGMTGYGYGCGTGYGTGYGYRSGYGNGTGDGYGTGEGPGYDGYSYDEGPGHGTCDGTGQGDGTGDGDGTGTGYGTGDGYGTGYGDGDGYGTGEDDSSGHCEGDGYCHGEDDATYWGLVLARYQAGSGVLALWWSDRAGLACNGGSALEPAAAVGAIHSDPGPLALCRRGSLHATLNPCRWRGDRLWVVVLRGEVLASGDKLCALRREIVGEVSLWKTG